MQNVYVLSSARTDFGEKWGNPEGFHIHKKLGDILDETIKNAPFNFKTEYIDRGYIGNFASGSYANQGHLAGLMATELSNFIDRFGSINIQENRNACASSGGSLHNAINDIRYGVKDTEVAIVVGIEHMRVGSPELIVKILAEGMDKRFDEYLAPMCGFGELTRMYMEKYHISKKEYDEAVAFAIANNYKNARSNPNAQLRDNDLTYEFASQVQPKMGGRGIIFEKGNKRFEGDNYPIKMRDCSQITDGVAALILVSEKYMKELGLGEGVRVIGNELQTDKLSVKSRFIQEKIPDRFNGLDNALGGAFKEAGLNLETDVKNMSYIELHDCFAITEMVLLEHLGFAKPGKSFNLGGEFWDEWGSKINPSGGLMADGHPIGATGVRMMYELTNRLELGQKGMMVNIGDVFTSNYVAILEKSKII